MKRPTIKTAGIMNTIFFSGAIIASCYSIFLGWITLLATITAGGSGSIVSLFTWILAMVTSILFFAGILLLIYSIIMLVASAKLIKKSGLPAEQFKKKRGGIITYLVFIFLTFFSFVYLIVTQTDYIFIFIFVAVYLLITAILLIVGLSKKEVQKNPVLTESVVEKVETKNAE